MRIFKDLGFTRTEQRFTFLDLISVCISTSIACIVIALIVFVRFQDRYSMLEICVDKGIDIALVFFVSFYLTNRYEKKNHLKQSVLECLKESKDTFEKLTASGCKGFSCNDANEHILDVLEEAKNILFATGYRRYATSVEEVGKLIASSTSMQIFMFSNLENEQFKDFKRYVIKKLNQLIIDITIK